MSNLKICRICLRTEAKMYKYDRFQLKIYYEEITALKVPENDDLPQYMCYECATMLHKFHKFKEKCYNGQRVLKEIQWTGNITYEAIYKIDRQNTNLESPLSVVTLSDKVKGYNIKEVDLSSVKHEIKERHTDDFDLYSDYSNDKDLLINENVEKSKERDAPYSPVAMVVDEKRESILKYEEYKKRKRSRDDDDEPNRKMKKGLDLSNWKVYSLTEEQALEEFRARAEHPKYLAARYKCSECFKGFSKKEMLERHTKKRHFEGIGDYECWFCRMRYKWKCMLRKHMLQHYYKFECLRCDLVCMQENTAVLHEEFHSGEMKQCIHCEQKFK
ncbi:hypothetical protein O3G_MSEX006141 [Manduca sexta]|uniref:Uncharacterized protein n=2 Tax=Manduca sexta TaxID=7130 RepID=A0A922CKJ4_MANSE|nr:hypothetical protein O3G_MSEX006141 [Manduca sexta]